MAEKYEIVTDHHYIMCECDFADGCVTVTDAASGRTIGIGEHRLGYPVKAYLNVPLCKGCDNPVEGALCHSCELIHADLIPDEVVGDPFEGRFAA